MELQASLLELMKQDKKKFLSVIEQAKYNYNKMYDDKINDPSLKDGSSHEDYFSSLTMIEDWIQKCIDEIRIYLKPICYPLFVHLYLNLLASKRHSEYAQKFLNENKDKYIAFQDEIDKLSLLKYPLDMNNSLVQNYFFNKVHIFIPNETFNFFLHFLNTKRLILVIEILNKFFQRSNILSKISQSEEEKNKFLLLNNTSEDIQKINSRTQIYYNKINKDIIDNLTKAKKGGKNYDSLLSKIIIPFPETANEFLNVENNCLKINKSSPPTIGCFTLLNTNNKLNCIDMTNDGGIIACGFKNGEIIVWVLDKRINIEITQESLKELDNYKNKDFATLIKIQLSQNKEEEKKSKIEQDNNQTNVENPNPQFLYELITKSHRKFSLYGHQSTVYSISISPDNQYLISGSYDSTIRLWNLHTKTCFGVYKGHFCPILCVKFSPITHYFASGACDKTARLWSINSAGALRIFVGHLSDVELVDFHPNGLYLITSANDKTIRMWILKSGECCRIFVNYSLVNSFIDCMCFSNSGKLLAVGVDKGIIIYDLVKMGDPVSIVTNLTNKTITSISFDNDDNVIVCCTEDYKINFYDIDSILNSEDNLQINNEKDKKVELIYSYLTKKTTILQTKFTSTNLMLIAGRFDDNDPKIFN